MHNQKKSSVITLGRKALSVAVASSLFMLSSAHATGLGKLTVLSALGQPLRAEIELTSPSKEEIDSLVPRLASPDAFKQANIDFNSALLSLRFAVEQRGQAYVIRISSAQAMNEPFVDMLLELNSANGKLMREYTFLLDPAELRNSQSAQVTNPTTVANQPQNAAGRNTAQNGRELNAVANAAAGRAATKAPAASTEGKKEVKAAGDYQVRNGDTLGKIAGSYKPEGVSLDQMLVSLYRANPQAFNGSNMNRLKSGQILTIPDAETVRSTTGGEAHSVVTAHAADFNAYRNRLADQVASAPAEKTPATGKQSAGGAITAKVKEVPTATSDSPDKLKLSKANPAEAKNAKGKGGSEEDRLAKDKAAAEASARMKELEKNVGDLQKLLEVKNKDLAAKQAELNAKEQKSKASASAAASVPAPAPAPVAAPVSTPAPAPAPAPVVASAASVAASASAPVSAAASTAASVATPKPPVKRKVVAPPPPPPPEPGFFDNLSDFLLPGGAAILALLGGYGIYTSRRKKKLQQFEDSILTGSSMKANSMFGSTGGQSVDTNNSVFNSNFAPSASQLDANEVDPVAEADVYIAYGRDSQAEEILKEALRTQPDRHAVRVKLLEIYFARKDAKTFERLASELYGMTSGEGDDWSQAASMGIVLEPGNPLYAGGKAKPDAAAGTGLGSGTQPLEDLDPEALLGNSLSQDMLEAISIIDTAQRDSGSAAKAAEPAAMDEGALDFDLDISDAAEPEVPKIPEAVEKAKPVEEHAAPEVDFGTIDFDFGVKEPEPAAVAPLEIHAAPAVPAATEAEADKFDLDLGMDFSSDKSDAAPLTLSSSTSAAEATAELERELMAALSVEPEAEASSALNLTPAPADAGTSFEFDLSGIDLDLAPADAPAAAVEAESPAHNAEMATKLDLAVAYHEIGDKEGARELLDEVVKGGTAEQVEKAKGMIAEMA
ncbi:FimV/HubP family polar landmark protein [Undibacterium sp. Ji49W]|uniref:FimV/HubP family polar landmark protein n=1 Tax=Undibacterium sp. Ji49W TaxID=3413040 RepID=UPI003BEF9E91